MKSRNDIERSDHFINFKRNVALRKITTTIRFPKNGTNGAPQQFHEMSHKWQFYTDGEHHRQQQQQQQQTHTRNTSTQNDEKPLPLVCLGGISGRADQFYDLMLSLCPRGVWIMSVDLPITYTYEEFILAFEAFLRHLKIDRCHLLGAQFGGFLVQIFADARPAMVDSLVLCNTFVSNLVLAEGNPFADIYNFLPGFILKKLVLKSFPQGSYTKPVNDAIDFMVDKLESLTRKEIASRMTLSCLEKRLPSGSKIDDHRVTIIDTLDESIYPQHMREAVYDRYPNSRKAFMKMGNAFPYLSNPEEFSLHVQVHMRNVSYHHSHDASDESSSSSDDRGEADYMPDQSGDDDAERTSIVNEESEAEEEQEEEQEQEEREAEEEQEQEREGVEGEEEREEEEEEQEGEDLVDAPLI